MTPAELIALAELATPGPWEVSTYEIFSPASKERMKRIAFTHEWMNEADARLIALAPDLARLCAEMGEALENAGNDFGLIMAMLKYDNSPQSETALKGQKDVRAAVAKLSELEART